MGARKSARFTLRFKLESQFQPWRVAWLPPGAVYLAGRGWHPGSLAAGVGAGGRFVAPWDGYPASTDSWQSQRQGL